MKIQYLSLIITALQIRGCIFKCLFKGTVTDSTVRENIIPEAHSFLSNSHIWSGSDLIRFNIWFCFLFSFFLFFLFFLKYSYTFPQGHVFCNYSLNIWFLSKSLGQQICFALDKLQVCKTMIWSMYLGNPLLSSIPLIQRRLPASFQETWTLFSKILCKY